MFLVGTLITKKLFNNFIKTTIVNYEHKYSSGSESISQTNGIPETSNE